MFIYSSWFFHVLELLLQMLSSGLPGLTSTDDILYVRDALLPGKSDLEATHTFTKLVLNTSAPMATRYNYSIFCFGLKVYC